MIAPGFFYGYVQNDPVNLVDPWGLAGYPYYPRWSDVGRAGSDAVSATQQGVKAAADLTTSGPAPARNTLQAAIVVAGAPVAAAGVTEAVVAATTAALSNPSGASDFLQGALDPGPPPPTIPGALGAAVNRAVTTIIDNYDAISDALDLMMDDKCLY